MHLEEKKFLLRTQDVTEYEVLLVSENKVKRKREREKKWRRSLTWRWGMKKEVTCITSFLLGDQKEEKCKNDECKENKVYINT